MGLKVEISPTNLVVSGVTGTPLRIVGQAKVLMQIPEHKFVANIMVVDQMEYDVLLGIDVIKGRGLVLDFSSSECRNRRPQTAYVKLNSETIIPANTRHVCSARLARRLDNCKEVWLSPQTLSEEGVCVEEAVADLTDDCSTTVSIINNNYSITLPHQTRLAL